MNKIFSSFIAISLIIGICSCKNKSDNTIVSDDNSEEYIVSLSNLSNDNTACDSIGYVMLNNSGSSYPSAISKVICRNDRMYVYDRMGKNALYVFDNNGNFLHQIGNKGNAANEYIKLWDFDVTKDYVIIYDRMKKRVSFFDHDGNYQKGIESELIIDGFKSLGNGDYIVSLAKDDDMRQLCITNPNLEISREILSFDQNDMDDKISDNLFHETNGGFIYNKPVNNTIYLFDNNGESAGSYRLDFEGHNVPDNLKGNYDKMNSSNSKEKYVYMFDCPLKIKDKLICPIFINNSKASLVYDIDKKTNMIQEWKPGLKSDNIILPVGIYNDKLIGWMDLSVLELIDDKDAIPENVKKHLTDGGISLVFYNIK